MARTVTALQARFFGESLRSSNDALAAEFWIPIVGNQDLTPGYQPGEAYNYFFPGGLDQVNDYANRGTTPAFPTVSRHVFHTSGGLTPEEYVQNSKLDEWIAHWTPTFSGTLNNLTVNIESNLRLAAMSITVYKNDVASSLTVTIPAITSGVILGTGSCSFSAGDKIIGKVTVNASDMVGPYDAWDNAVAYVVGDVVDRNGTFYVCKIAHAAFQDPEDFEGSGWTYWEDIANAYCNFTSLSMAINTDDAFGYVPLETSATLNESGAAKESWPLGSGNFGFQIERGVDYAEGGPTKTPTSDSKLESYWPLSFIPTGIWGATYAWDGVTAAERLRAQECMFRTTGTLQDFRIFREESEIPSSTGYDLQPIKVGLKKNGSWALEIQPTEDATWTECDWETSATTVTIASGDKVAIGHDLLDGTIPAGVDGTDWQMARGHYSLPKMLYVSDDEWFDIHAHGVSTTGELYSTYYADEADMYEYTGNIQYFNLFSSAQQDATTEQSRAYFEYGTAEGMEFRNLRVNVGYFSGTPVTLGLMIDGVAGEQSVTIDGTGWFEDTVNTDLAAQTEGSTAQICYYLDPGEGGAFMRIDSIEITARLTDQTAVLTCEKDCDGALTMVEMRERTLKMLGEDPDAPIYWSNDEIDRYIGDAYIKAARESKAIEYIEGIELAADDETGVLSDYVGQILRVTYDDRKIENTTKFELDRFEADWENQSGYVDSYVTTLHDNRRISTFKAWDGGADNSYGPFYSDGAHTYAAWATSTAYADGDRVTVEDADGITRGYVCTSAHTSAAATEPGTGASWETVWVPIVLMVWAVKNPGAITGECAEPELPPYSHLGLCFAAAAAALLKHGEMRDEGMAAFYASIAQEYLSLLKGYTNNRTPERVLAVGGQTVGIRIPKPWDRVIQ